MLDTHGRVASWNTGAERIKGYRADEIMGMHFSTFYPKESVESGHPENELKVAAAEGRFEEEGWRIGKDGSRFWANVVITALRDRAGELKGFSKITRDLTERKRAEATVREREARYRRLFEASRDGVVIVDIPTGRIIDANPAISEALGHAHDELLGKELWQIGLFPDGEANRKALTSCAILWLPSRTP